MPQLFTYITSDLCLVFLILSFIFLTLLLFILQVPTISLLVPILSTMVAPSFKEPSVVPFLSVSTLIATTLHSQGHFIFRPTMLPLELQVVLLKPFLDFVHGYQCRICSSVNLYLLHNNPVLSWYTCQDMSDLILFIQYMVLFLQLVYLYGQ